MSGHPRLPIHVGDYLKDTPAISFATWQHHGIYMLSIMIAWNVPGVRLPIDATWLSLRFGCSIDQLEEHVRPVVETYWKRRGNFYYQKRLSHEAKFIALMVEKQRARANRKWQKEKDLCHGIVPAMQENMPPTPTPTPTKERKISVRPKFPTAEFEAFWAECPKKVAKGAAEKVFARIVRAGEADAITLTGCMRAYALTQYGKDRAYTKTPAPWLNEKRWLDDGISPASVPTPEQIAVAKDRADKILGRGKYAPNYEGPTDGK